MTAQRFSGPGYASSLIEGAGNAYRPLTDDWEGYTINMRGLDEVIIDCSIVAGNQAQLRFRKDGIWGPPLPIKIGISARSDLAKRGFDAVQFRNATAGSTAEVIVEAYPIGG